MSAKVSVDTLQQEGLRLLKQQIELIEDMTKAENLVLAEKDSQGKQSFTQESAREDIEVLGEEVKKLEGLVLVVAVVGTMKAGKSTAINAIVGTEVLPVRNRAMTAVPTLIKHKPNTTDPVLLFENQSPVDGLVKRLRAALKGSHQLAPKINSDPHFKDLVNSVERGVKFKTRYEGAAEIAEFLKDLNDLVRLSRALDIEFPFDSYDSVEEMPVIEVEFAHIEEVSGKGELCLLDTPGPNESGQPNLQKILQEQLAKASAVVAVLNYAQMGTKADAEVRGEIHKIAAAMDNRAYALVNKFDQRDRHGDDEAQLKYQVSEDLLKGSVAADRVFPVSANWAYLSNRARHELRNAGHLPNASESPWVEDFGKAAFGRRWERQLKDAEEVRANADELWKDSLFAGFLEHVVQAAHEDAATLAVESASGKLGVYGERISNCLSVRGNSLKMDADKAISDLEAQIQALEADSTRIQDSEKEARREADKLLKDFDDELKQVSSQTTNELGKAIDKFFREGRRIQKAEFKKKVERERKSRQPKGLTRLVGQIMQVVTSNQEGNNERIFEPNESSVEIKSQNKAKDLIRKISDSIDEIKNASEDHLRRQIDETGKQYSGKIESILGDSAAEVVVALNKRLGVDFGVRIEAPKSENLKIEKWALDSLDNSMRQEEYEVTKRRRTSSTWGKICKWFGTKKWGWETYSVEKTKYIIDIDEIRTSVQDNMKRFIKAVTKSVNKDIATPLHENIKRHCQELREKVQRLQGDFKQSIRDRNLEKNPQKALIREIDLIFKRAKKIQHDLEGFAKDIEALASSGSEPNSRSVG